MGYIIGESSTYATWLRLRRLGITNNTGTPPITGGAFNQVFPSGNYFLKTQQGNGFTRSYLNASYRFEKTLGPPQEDTIYVFGFAEPDNETVIGQTVTTTGSSFTITADAFLPGGQTVGTGGNLPITSVQYFEFLT